MECYLFLLILQLWSWQAKAIPAPTLPTATKFYRMRLSSFASGQASRNELTENLVRQEFELSYRGHWDHKKFLLSGSSLVRDVQVAKRLVTKRNSQLLAEKKSNSRDILSLPEGIQLTVIETDSYWAKVYEPARKLTGYVPLHHLTASWSDPGVFVNIIPTMIRKQPKSLSATLTVLPKMSRVEPLEIKGGWMKIAYAGFYGYVDMSHFLGRADYAVKAMVDKIGWVNVRYRTLDEIITDKSARYAIADVTGYWSDPNVGIVSENQNYSNPPLKAHFKIEKLEARLWGVSRIPLHGEIYWIKSDFVEGQNPKVASVLQNKDLLARGVYSVAFANPKAQKPSVTGLRLPSAVLANKLHGIASSNGIYKTEDGEHWTSIDIFGKSNYPVAIHSDGTWLVGPYKSIDQGKTFESFIRWDELTKKLQPSLSRQARYLKLQKIEPYGPNQVKLYLDFGFDKAVIKTSTLGGHFTLVSIGI